MAQSSSASASASASTSTSTSTSTSANSKYDVFISHRGLDVKKTFASHLYRRLLSGGLRVFLDQPELKRGDYLTPQIHDAIQSASVHVAIFSVGYADSIWCLNVLVEMLDTRGVIFPVFYNVEPSDLRWTQSKKGKYAESLDKLEQKTDENPRTHEQKLRYDSSQIENWRQALSHAAEISGFELKNCNGDEGELVDKVVKQVLKKVKKLALYVATYPTGLDDKVNHFENTVLKQLQQSGKPQILGILGLGGVGKTTLVKEIFNRKNSDYGISCFLTDIKDNACKGRLLLLQKKLLRILNVPDVAIDRVNSVDEGIGILKTYLSPVRVLVVLDDVDDVDQVDALLPVQTVLSSDSIILVTSRNKDVLIRSKIEESSIYNLTGLDKQQSRKLFCLHAFNHPDPLPEFESVVVKILKTCNGFPLSLKVIGALLYGKQLCHWEDELSRLEKILPDEIQQRLKISYLSLNSEVKNMFLDVACFFRGENKDRAIDIWDGSGWHGRRGFQVLRNRCLVEVDSKNNIQMHDHLRDMGRDIAKDPKLPCRLWCWTEDTIEDLLQLPQGRVVRGIVGLRAYHHIDVDEVFGDIRMKGLQLLDTEGALVERILAKVDSPNLKWLRWVNCPHSSLPSSISMRNLRVLQVGGLELKTLWQNESLGPLQLRDLEIEAPLSNISKFIGPLKHLKRIMIGHICPRRWERSQEEKLSFNTIS